jgi:hypothetical protein
LNYVLESFQKIKPQNRGNLTNNITNTEISLFLKYFLKMQSNLILNNTLKVFIKKFIIYQQLSKNLLLNSATQFNTKTNPFIFSSENFLSSSGNLPNKNFFVKKLKNTLTLKTHFIFNLLN